MFHDVFSKEKNKTEVVWQGHNVKKKKKRKKERKRPTYIVGQNVSISSQKIFLKIKQTFIIFITIVTMIAVTITSH